MRLSVYQFSMQRNNRWEIGFCFFEIRWMDGCVYSTLSFQNPLPLPTSIRLSFLFKYVLILLLQSRTFQIADIF